MRLTSHPYRKPHMTITPGIHSRRALLAVLTTLAALVAWLSPHSPTAAAAPVISNALPQQASSLWPAPAAPLDTTPIGPMETVGAAASE